MSTANSDSVLESRLRFSGTVPDLVNLVAKIHLRDSLIIFKSRTDCDFDEHLVDIHEIVGTFRVYYYTRIRRLRIPSRKKAVFTMKDGYDEVGFIDLSNVKIVVDKI